jgi:hypothetical protein
MDFVIASLDSVLKLLVLVTQHCFPSLQLVYPLSVQRNYS